jgi:hypothetical protein
VADLGGFDEVSTAERILAEKAANLTLQMHALEARMDEGDTTSATLDLYGRGCGHLTRMLKTLGVKRRAKDITPGKNALIELWELEGRIAKEDTTDE